MAEVSIGSIVAGYPIEGLAAEGGMGRVYRATQMALGRQVALKDGTRARSARERLRRRLAPGRSPPIYEAGEADRQLFIAMRWVEGTDLRSVIPARRAGSSIALSKAVDVHRTDQRLVGGKRLREGWIAAE